MAITTVRLRRLIAAILAKPECCSADNDEQVYQMARIAAHTALSVTPDLCPGWQVRYQMAAPLAQLHMIRLHVAAYRGALRILRASFTSVAERKAAIDMRDEFLASAPGYVEELVLGIDTLISYTDGEECADPESCNHASGDPVWLCSRCRLRECTR